MSLTESIKARKLARKRDQRGAALVESALVLVPLCIIIFGIIEFGFIFKDSLSISNASRSGARVASAEPNEDGFFADTVSAVTNAGTAAGFNNGDHLWIYAVNPNDSAVSQDGKLKTSCVSATDPGSKCRQYTWNNGGWSGDTSAGGVWPPSTHVTCIGNNNIESVGVQLQVTHKSITGFFPIQSLKLTERTVMRLEPQSTCS